MRIVYIDIDTLRPDHLGCYGYPRATSPTIDEIARTGTVFRGCYVSDAPCLPSRTALFSGRFGIHNGVVGHGGGASRMAYPGDGHQTDPDRMPLPMILSRAGIPTATFTTFAQHHLAWHFYAGWDEIHKHSNKNGLEIADEIHHALMPWLSVNAQRESFFLHVNYWDPHTPYRTPLRFGDPFRDEAGPEWPTADVLGEHQLGFGEFSAPDFVDLSAGFPRLPTTMRTEDDFKRWIDAYDAAIAYTDMHIERMLHVLDEADALDDTAIIISADHGENQGELNVYGDHPLADECTGHVPLIVKWPGGASGHAVDGLCYQLDLAPTLCELLDIETPARWDGESFAATLRGTPWQGRSHLVVGQGARTCQRAVRTDDYIFIRTYHAGLGDYDKTMLFDVAKDPHETHNLAADMPGVVRDCDHTLTEWWHACLSGVEAHGDPLLTVMEEGGPWYARLNHETYAARLEATGRKWAAAEVRRRMLRPGHPRYEGELSDPRLVQAVGSTLSANGGRQLG